VNIVVDENVSYGLVEKLRRFPAEKTKGIIYIRHGNLKSEEEIMMVENCLRSHDLEILQGKLVTLYRDSVKFR
jgi:hypothetical protein